ncbi:tetratricopeptide repeat protein [Bradyrhizobium manausense]|uniref:O-linked N-acetylglucosamine transferase, SPINDLY family protein n=1 Tax=Bradyrhizobium TaxID=374 RepID=UPI001BA61A15|nr:MULTISPECIES: tetratricopeptide repeat protein [Bradyrhizobium]MBR0829566.1 tetratricopeptide repeat protein [Bradyrhizobium manausense]UVO25936.1 tetratricopeptide repeat protein [Bradyrhizobium arachidis]
MSQQSRNKGASAPSSLHTSAILDQAIAAHRSGDLPAAERAYTTILRGSRTHPIALHMLGLLHAQRGNFADAEPLLKKAVRVDSGNPDVLFNYANVLRALDKTDDALAWLAKAIALSPNFADAHLNRGAILMARQELHGAIAEFDRAIAIAPSSAAFANRGSAFQQLDRLDEAHDSYQRAVELAPSNPQNHFALSEVLAQLGRHDEAVAALERTVALKKAFPFALSKLVASRRQLADWRSFETEQAALDEAVEAGVAVDPFTFFHASSSPAHQLTCAKTYVANVAPERGAAIPKTPSPVSRLRVAYMSADFRSHATAHLMAGLFEEHDRERFDVSAISYGPDDRSEMRGRLKAAFERFEDVSHLTDEDVVKLIRQLDIEVLVDLGGFTAGARPKILARRPAPIQVNYLGFPGTMGASYIDYIMADRIVIPEGEQKHYAEKVIYLPDSYQATDAKRTDLSNVPARSEVGLADDAFVYCAFNRTSKITPLLFDVWMRLLTKTAGSVLWLLDSDPIARENLRREAVARGIAAERIVFAPHVPPEEHLARHQLADLFLDTSPYNAHTAASDALWAGLPVLTCLGTAFAGRVAASLLNAVGLPELVTRSLDEYEGLALRIAHDSELRTALKSKLKTHRSTWPLFDTVGMTRHVEKAFNEIWRRHCAGEAPASFAV